MPVQTLRPRLGALESRLRAIAPELGAWRAPDASSAERGYGHKWRTARAAYLREHPLCVYCAEAGRVTAADVVDHIEPHRGDQALFWRRSNWQALCTRCHASTKARLERSAAGRG